MNDPTHKESVVVSLADALAKRRARRGFLKAAAKLTAVLGASTFGLVFLEQKADAAFCCTPAYSQTCPNCPSCPSGTLTTNCDLNPCQYTWTCCYVGCVYYCEDCPNRISSNSCACVWTFNELCGSECLGQRPQRKAG